MKVIVCTKIKREKKHTLTHAGSKYFFFQYQIQYCDQMWNNDNVYRLIYFRLVKNTNALTR